MVTRFTLFKEMKYDTDSKQTKKADCHVEGGVEQDSPYDVTDEPPTSSKPATLFVPMFAPDQVAGAYNNWFLYKSGKTSYYWSDVLSTSYTAAQRQAYMPKYFDIASIGYVAPYGTQPAGQDVGPNASCTTQAITPLTDVTATAGMDKIKTAIDAMQPLGGTNVVSGLAWGWRVVSSALPFSEGRPESEKGNDKVVIVLTDGANTYYTPSYLGYNDDAGNKSIYADLGFVVPFANAYQYGRLFLNTSSNGKKSGSGAYDNDNYTNAMNEQMAKLCQNAKDANVLVMTVSLDIDPSKISNKSDKAAAQAQIDGLKACASDSRYRKDPTDPSKPAKLYWNATGADLSDKFKEIADELSIAPRTAMTHVSNILAKLGYEANGHRVDLGYERGRDEADRLIKMNMGLAGDELHPLEVSRDSVNLKYTTTEATDYWDPEIAVYYTQNDYWRNNYAARTNGNMNLNEDLFGGKAQNTFTTDYGKITAGFDVGQHNYHTDNYGNNNRQYRDFDTLQTGAFVQGRFEFDNSFKVSTGARLDHHRFTDWDDNAFPFRRQPTSRSPMRSTKHEVFAGFEHLARIVVGTRLCPCPPRAYLHRSRLEPVARRITRSAPFRLWRLAWRVTSFDTRINGC